MNTAKAVLATSALAGAAMANCQYDGSKTGVANLKQAATKLLVDSTGTSLDGTNNKWFTADEVNTIDRFLGVEVVLPEVTLDGSGFFNNDQHLCSRTWKCDKQDYTVCPGETRTTAQFRSYTTDTLEGQDKFRPKFSFPTTKGKKYSLIMVDLFSPKFAESGSKIGFTNTCFFHYMAFNFENADALNAMDGTDKDREPMGPLVGAGNIQYGEPNKYTFLLYEHDGDLTFDAQKITDTFLACDLDNTFSITGLDNAELVSFSYFQGETSMSSRLTSLANEGLAPAVDAIFSSTCDNLIPKDESSYSFDSALDMCPYGKPQPEINARAKQLLSSLKRMAVRTGL